MAETASAAAPRQEWARALYAHLKEGNWLAGALLPSGRDALIRSFARHLERMKMENAPKAAEKAVRDWLDGATPHSKALDPLCLALFGQDWESNPRCTAFRALWGVASKSPKTTRFDQAPAAPVVADIPETMTALAWETHHAWQTMGLATLYIDPPSFLNDREGYRLFVSVSLGEYDFSIAGTTFRVRLRGALLEPDYKFCHPVSGSIPGERGRQHGHIEVRGGRYHFDGPRRNEFLAGNPFAAVPGPPPPEKGESETDDAAGSATPFAEVIWDRSGANWVTVTLSSREGDVDIAPVDETKPVSIERKQLIQHYLRKILAKREAGAVHWARASLSGKVRK